MYYFGNLIVDNFLLETMFIISFHEPRHDEISDLYFSQHTTPFVTNYSNSEQGRIFAQHAHVAGTGINLQTTIASQDYINHLLLNKTPHLTRSTYISNKMTGFVYVTRLNFGDPLNYMANMKRQGISITKA